jgi:hypothetical protein
MTRSRFTFLILAHGVAFLFWASLLKSFVVNYGITSEAARLAISFGCALPILSALYFIQRRYQQFENDEYQQLLLMRQTFGASIAVIVYTAIFGFQQWIDPDIVHRSAFASSILFWFIGWAMGGFMRKDKTE